jgi:hypothetical protein
MLFKKSIVVLLIVLMPSLGFCDVYVHGYFRKNGTYVQSHYRSSPNNTKLDNWSTKGNINPYTGKIGTKSIGSDSFNNYKSESGPVLNGYKNAQPNSVNDPTRSTGTSLKASGSYGY